MKGGGEGEGGSDGGEKVKKKRKTGKVSQGQERKKRKKEGKESHVSAKKKILHNQWAKNPHPLMVRLTSLLGLFSAERRAGNKVDGSSP